MVDIKGMLEGWSKVTLDYMLDRMPPQVEERLRICDKCPVRSNLICDSNKGGCGCVLIAKARATMTGKTCPLSKWQEVDTKYQK
jgi:hypothetical protein